MKTTLFVSALVLLLAGCGGTCPAPTTNPCASGGHGTIAVTVSGLPAGLDARVSLTGPESHDVTRTQTLSGVGSGAWGVSAERVTDHDPLVRTAYQPTVDPASFCLPDGGTQNVTVTYAPIASSNKLWATNGTGGSGQLLGYGSASLRASGMPAASVSVQGPGGGDLAFDKDGNLWTMGPTTADATLNRFPAAQLGTSGAKTPDRQLNLTGTACGPLVKGIAFDAAGNLWLTSPCRQQVLKLDAASLEASGDVTPSVTLTVMDPVGLAFDSAGDLWVGDQASQRLIRFDAASLATGASPSLTLGAKATDDPMNPAVLTPNWVAFDAGGNLWSNDFGGNIFFRVSVSDLSRSGDVTVAPRVRITAGVTALLEGFAFDGEGGLWSAGVAGTVVRFAPDQLDVSSGAGAPTVPAVVLTSADIGYVSNLAFYPAPAALPLYSSLP